MKPSCSLSFTIFLLIVTGLHVIAQVPLPDLYYSGNYQEVIGKSQARISSGDTTFNTFYLKALSEAQLGQNSRAIQTLDRALMLHPGDSRLLRMQAGQLFEAGDYLQARRGYQNLVSQDSTDVSSWMKLAEIASFRQNYDQAINALNQVLVLDSMNLSSLMMMGDILNRHNNSGAVVYYARAYRLYPENQKAAYALANMHIQSRKARKAIPICEQMLEIDSSNIKFSKLLGYAHYKAGAPGKAVQWFDYAVALGDSTTFTLKFKGISHYLRTDFGAAIGALEDAVKKDSLDAELHFFLGASLSTIADMENAMYHLNLSLELMKPDPSVVSRIYSEQGNIKRLEMKYEEAYSYYEKAWISDSTNVISLYFMASILDNSLQLSKDALVDYQRYIDALNQLPENKESNQGISIRAIVEDRIITLKEELFFRDE